MVHDLDPFLWRISGEFGIRWYGLSYMLGFLVAYYFIMWLAKKRRTEVKPANVADFITYGAIGILAGGRLGYCLFYSPDLFWKFKESFPYWGVLAVNEGGMASHGGIIGLVIACILFARKYQVNRLHLFDLCAITGPIGIFFGRIANFINGELVGRICPTDYPLAVRFPQDILHWPSTDPQKLSSLSTVVETIGVKSSQWSEWLGKFQFDSASRQSVQNTLYQVIDAIQSGNEAAKLAIAPMLDPRYPSQLIAALGEGLILFLILFIFWRKPRKPGVVGALFVTLYAIARICTEMFRLPDLQIGYQWLGLTRGQWLSAAMLLIGLFLLILFTNRKTLAISGWGRKE